MALIQINFMSECLLRTVTVNAIVPFDKITMPGMPEREKKPFKTLYLLHGILGNYTDWLSGTRIQRWAEEKNLAVIMPSGENHFYVDCKATGERYSEFIGWELPQKMRTLFPLSEKREDTFIAGLSMGGYGAITNGLKYHETFGCAAGLSSALILDKICNKKEEAEQDLTALMFGEDYTKTIFGAIEQIAGSDKDYKALALKLKDNNINIPKLFLCCGTEDTLLEANRDFSDFLKANQIPHEYAEGPGGHEWDFWDTWIKNVLDWLPLEDTPADLPVELPAIRGDSERSYDIDDIDGALYMLEHRFSGCLMIQFTKTMKESVYGKVTCDGEELPRGLIKAIEIAGGLQMCGIPVRDKFLEYDKVYHLQVEGFQDTDGNKMIPQEITVRTLPKAMPDPAYEEHDEIALQAAREGIVLLKNQDNLLPLAPDTSLYVKGAEQFRVGAVGAGKINPRYTVGLNRALQDYSSFQLSEDSHIGIIVISRPSGENFDNNALKGEFYLSEEEEQTVSEMSSRYKKVIAVLNSGYPMDVRWLEQYQVTAAIWCGFPGMLGGKALVEILDGRVNPSGKLPDTWSLDYMDIPASANFYQPESADQALDADCGYYVDTYYEEDIYVGYRYFETFEKPVAYPFGYGLSYTTFDITANLTAEEESEGSGLIKVNIKNTGSAAGKEVVGIYAAIPDGKLEQPSRRLIRFAKTKLLEPGEVQEIKIPVEKGNLSSYDEETASWVMEAGSYDFYAGSSVKQLQKCGTLQTDKTNIIKKVENRMRPPVKIDVLTKEKNKFPQGLHSGIKENVTELEPLATRKHYKEKALAGSDLGQADFVDQLCVEELARLSVCASHGWGMHEKGEAGRIFRLEQYNMPGFAVADGNNGVNLRKPNIGMPCSNTVCASWNTELAYAVGRVIAQEAKENDIQMILGPAMNIHRNPLNGRHPEYYSEDPYLAGIMAGYQSKGLEEEGVSSCIKHVVANNCEASRKRNHSLMTERAMREIYLKVFEVAISVHQPDSMMTAYNAANGCFTSADEEMIQGIFREEFGFQGFVMTDWNAYDTADVAASVQAGNCWMTPGTADDTYVTPIVEGVKTGKIDLERLRSNVRYMLRVVQKRTGQNLGVK